MAPADARRAAVVVIGSARVPARWIGDAPPPMTGCAVPTFSAGEVPAAPKAPPVPIRSKATRTSPPSTAPGVSTMFSAALVSKYVPM